jgi:hypothetical protein
MVWPFHAVLAARSPGRVVRVIQSGGKDIRVMAHPEGFR